MSIQDRVIRWLLSDATGSSSKAIVRSMVGVKGGGSGDYPHDAGDLSRCLLLLAEVPEWKPRLKEMAGRGPEWAALVEHWDELAALRSDGDKCYRRIREILDPIEAKDKNLFRFGKATVRFSA